MITGTLTFSGCCAITRTIQIYRYMYMYVPEYIIHARAAIRARASTEKRENYAVTRASCTRAYIKRPAAAAAAAVKPAL